MVTTFRPPSLPAHYALLAQALDLMGHNSIVVDGAPIEGGDLAYRLPTLMAEVHATSVPAEDKETRGFEVRESLGWTHLRIDTLEADELGRRGEIVAIARRGRPSLNRSDLEHFASDTGRSFEPSVINAAWPKFSEVTNTNAGLGLRLRSYAKAAWIVLGERISQLASRRP